MFQHDRQAFSAQPGPASAALPDILGAFSYALDLTEGQPAGHSVRCCWIAMRLAQALGFAEGERQHIYYAVLMKDLGCSSNAARVAEIFLADDRHMKLNFKTIGPSPTDFIEFISAETGKDSSADERSAAMAAIVEAGAELLSGLIETRCNRGAMIARQLRFSEPTALGIAGLDEHWDGGGFPEGLTGQAIPVPARLALLAQVADVFFVIAGPQAARDEIARRSGTWLDPEMCQAFLTLSAEPDFWRLLGSSRIDVELKRLEPAPHKIMVDDTYLDDITQAFGQVIDAKSPFTGGHSARVGRITEGIAQELGIDTTARRRLRRAAILHDVGKLGVSSRILEKPGKLDDAERSVMQTHAGLTADILGRVGVMQDLAMIAASHHERLDGMGYPLNLDASAIARESRIITTADIYDALTADRPYRAAMDIDDAFAIMDSESPAAIDRDCLDALKSVVVEHRADR